jgi:hypothetical protein
LEEKSKVFLQIKFEMHISYRKVDVKQAGQGMGVKGR